MDLEKLISSINEEQPWNLEQLKNALTEEDLNALKYLFNSGTIDNLHQLLKENNTNLNAILHIKNSTLLIELVKLLKSEDKEIIKELFNLPTPSDLTELDVLLNCGVLDRLDQVLTNEKEPNNTKELKRFLKLDNLETLDKFKSLFSSNFFPNLKRLYLLGNPLALDEEDFKENMQIKFFIKKEDDGYYYFAYYHTQSDNGHINICKDTKGQNQDQYIKVGKVGDIIINYFNLDFTKIFDNSNIESSSLLDSYNGLELQNKTCILFENLFRKYFSDTNCLLPIYRMAYYIYIYILMNMFANEENKKDLRYILNDFKTSDKKYIKMNNKAIIQFMSDLRDILKYGYESLKLHNETNILNLSTHNNTSQIGYEILPDNENNQFLEVFTINDLITFLLFDIVQVNKYKVQINICENCGKYFKPINKDNEIYCNNLFNGSTRTCRQLSSEIKASNDIVTKLYRNAYKAQNGRKNRCLKFILDTERGENIAIKQKYVNVNFKDWHNKLQTQKINCEDGKITIEEFEQYIKDNSKINLYKKI